MSKTGCDHFMEEVTSIVNRMRYEYDMAYGEFIGCLELLKADILREYFDVAEEESDEEEEDDSV